MLKILIESVCRALKKVQLKYQNVREKWMSKTPWQKWNFIYNAGKTFSELIGIKVYSDMKFYWLTASGGILGLVYLSLTIYTVQYYLRQHNFTRAMACSYTFGIFILVSFGFLFYCWLVSKHQHVHLSLFKFRICAYIGYQLDHHALKSIVY